MARDDVMWRRFVFGAMSIVGLFVCLLACCVLYAAVFVKTKSEKEKKAMRRDHLRNAKKRYKNETIHDALHNSTRRGYVDDDEFVSARVAPVDAAASLTSSSSSSSSSSSALRADGDKELTIFDVYKHNTLKRDKTQAAQAHESDDLEDFNNSPDQHELDAFEHTFADALTLKRASHRPPLLDTDNESVAPAPPPPVDAATLRAADWSGASRATPPPMTGAATTRRARPGDDKLCSVCNSQPAVAKSTRNGQRVLVCAHCLSVARTLR